MVNPAALADFTPVPQDERSRPGRRRTITGELYLDRFIEHREAADFLDEMMNLGPGEGVKTIVRALLHYRDTVKHPEPSAHWENRGDKRRKVGRAKPVSPDQLSLT